MMMRRVLFVICCSVFIMTGCSLLPSSESGCAKGDPFSIFMYCKKTPYYPAGAGWVKDGMTREERLSDWRTCGGSADLKEGFRPWISPEPYETYGPEHEKHGKQLWSCMGSKGYRYLMTEKCSPDVCLYP
jgi:hypothetical protein